MEYSNSKEIIAQTNILKDEDMQFVDSQIDRFSANWRKSQRYRTETEMRVSVLNDLKFPTPAAKYWQCIREQSVFYEQLIQVSFSYRENKIDQEKLRRKIERLKNSDDPDADLKLLKADIKMEKLQYTQMQMEADAKDRVRELRLWSQLMDECTEADPEFDTEDVNQHQLESYVHRWQRQMVEMDKSGNTSPSERANLVGQLQSGLKRVKETGAKVRPLESLQQNMLPSVGSPENPTMSFSMTYGDMKGSKDAVRREQ